jgi:hypothetical protein
LEAGMYAVTSETVLSGLAAGRRVLSWRNTGMPVKFSGPGDVRVSNAAVNEADSALDPDVALWRKLRETWEISAESSKPVVTDGMGRSWKFEKPGWLSTITEEPKDTLPPATSLASVAAIPPAAPPQRHDTAFSAPVQPDAEAALALLVGKLQRALGCKTSDAILTVFRAVDANGNKLLSREELGA